tara:strand:- start:510 stop:674 length:165 start_codon:yes stop_codon:yes gene_type:complete
MFIPHRMAASLKRCAQIKIVAVPLVGYPRLLKKIILYSEFYFYALTYRIEMFFG